MEALPAIRPLYDDFGANYQAFAKDLGQEYGKLPFAMEVKHD